MQETRGFDEARGVTYSLRRKEEAVDYRFMPEPNLGPLRISPAQIAETLAELPELPDARHARLRTQYGLSVRDVNVLTRLNAEDDETSSTAPFPNAVDFFEEVVRLGCAPQTAANCTIHLLPKHLGSASLLFCENPVPPRGLAALVRALDDDLITRTWICSPRIDGAVSSQRVGALAGWPMGARRHRHGRADR